MSDLSAAINAAWEKRDQLGVTSKGAERDAVEAALDALDNGSLRVAEKIDGKWVVHEWLKKAVLLSFRLNDMKLISGAPGEAVWWDKVDSKFLGWDEAKFRAAGFRAVPGAVVRRSAFIAKGAVLLPSFVNVGAQVGSHCHISGGAGLGGVLEPLQAAPTIIEDNCFIGARAEVAEGVIVGEGSVLSMGVYLSASTKIIDRATGEVHLGKVPPYSVVVSGSAPSGNGPNLYCAVIVKRVDEKTRAKTSINELLRD